MSKALSRRFRGHDHEERDRAHADRGGSRKSVEEWLDEEIGDPMEDDEEADVEPNEGDRLEEITRRLARPGNARRRDREESRPPRRWRDDVEEMRASSGGRRRDSDSEGDAERAPKGPGDLEARLHRERGRPRDERRPDRATVVADATEVFERRVAASERRTARAFENLAELIKRGQRVEESAAVKRAVSALAERAEASERQTAQALSNLAGVIEDNQRGRETADEGLAYLAERLGKIESRLAEQPSPQASVRPIRAALARLESRLESLSGPDRAVDLEKTLNGFDQRLSEISRRLESERSAPPVAVSSTASAAMSGASAAALDQGLRSAQPLTRRPFVDAIAEITQRQRVLDEPVAPPPAPEPDVWGGEPPAMRFAALDQSLNLLSQQIESLRQHSGERGEQQMVMMRQVESLRREVEEMSRAVGDLAPRASILAVEAALRDLSQRIETQRLRGVADDLLAPAERIAGELRSVVKELDPGPILRSLDADVQAIGRRLDAMQQPSGVDLSAIRQLSAQTREIKDQLSAMAARPLPVEKLETRLFDLTQRVDALSYATIGPAQAAAALDMGELARSIRAIVAAETSASLDSFNSRLEQLAAKFDEAVLDAGAKRFDELGERIDALGRALGERLESVAAQKPVDAASIEQLVTSLGRKIDSALDDRPHGPGFEELGRKLDRLENRLDPPLADSLARIEEMLARPVADRQFAELAQRIDFVRETLAQRLDRSASPSADVSYIEELVRSLDNKIEAAIASGSKGGDFTVIQNQLDHLCAKVERLEDPSVNPKLGALLAAPRSNPQLDEISQRLERMQAALSHRAEESHRVESQQNELAALVGQLAARMDQALDPRGDTGAMRALERQISALSQRLDRSDANGAALAGVEARIAGLVTQMEETTAATTQAAEEAVRRATQDILRQANPDSNALREALERELADIRKIQDDSSERTHETLLAVHETLERVVERLAVFEEELNEIRVDSAAFRTPIPAGRHDEPAPRIARAPELAIEPRPAPRGETVGNEDLTDLLLPPGSQRPQRREPGFGSSEPSSGRPEAVQTDFIAAARRAAQQAAADAEAVGKAQQARRAAARPASAPVEDESAAKGVVGAIQERKRPLLLGLGALVLLVGAYQIARVGIQGATVNSHGGHEITEAAPAGEETPSAPAPKAEAPSAAPVVAPPSRAEAPAGAAPQSSKAPPARMIAPRTENMDSTPVGSIGNLAPLAPSDALDVIRSLAQQGDRVAQYELAVRYADGRGVARDAKIAAQWFEKAAAQGLAPAQYRVGSLYEKGVGVDRDYARARRYYQQAADAGNARAMHNLAVLLAEGGEGGKPDYVAASDWFRKAAELGVRDSQFNLAILYARGLGVGQSLTQSYLWFSAAAAQGDADAAKKRDDVSARLDSKELAAARALAAGFHAKEPIREANDVLPPKGGWGNVKDPNDSANTAKPAAKPVTKAKVSAI
jgi:localization factor PodJL